MGLCSVEYRTSTSIIFAESFSFWPDYRAELRHASVLP
jgi:hypothetical protein